MVQIITDSTSDLTPQQAKEKNVAVIPLTVHFGEEQFLDGIELSPRAFYEKLAKTETLPHTSQINPYTFTEVFSNYTKAGDDIVGIFISSKLSGTYQSAVLAKEELNSSQIFLVDSQSATFGQGILVEIAVRMRDEGKTAREIQSCLLSLAGRLRLVAMVDTLKYLKMGGRISSSTALIGTMLGINPMISVENGVVENIGKVRGQKSAFRFMKEYTEKYPPDLSYPMAFGHSACPERMEELISYMNFPVSSMITGEIGAVIGTHAGPKATGLAYICKK